MRLTVLLDVETSLQLLKQYVGDPSNRLFLSVDVIMLSTVTSEEVTVASGCEWRQAVEDFSLKSYRGYVEFLDLSSTVAVDRLMYQ